MDYTTNKKSFLASFSRCLKKENFLEVFYEKFISSNPEIKEKFRFVDFGRQTKMLANSIGVTISAIDGQQEGLAKLKELTVSHNRHHHDAKPEWYPLWIESLVETASETDPEWSEELETIWHSMLEMITKKMVSGYEG